LAIVRFATLAPLVAALLRDVEAVARLEECPWDALKRVSS
jgi:hypothetical protein